MTAAVVTTDVFRCAELNVTSVAENARWLLGLAYESVRRGTTGPSLFLSHSDHGSFDAAAYVQRHALNTGRESWAHLVNARVPESEEKAFADLLKADLVIGWGLTPALMELLDRNGIAFIDVEIDPVRFSEDIFLRARTNAPQISDYFAALHLDEASLNASVAEVRGFVCRRHATTLAAGPSYAVYAGQCAIDLSIVETGRVATPVDYLDKIREVARGVDILAIKPHPYDNDPHHLEALLEAVPNARITRANIYRLLADVKCARAVGLSSSALDEAALFGVATTRLIKPDRDFSELLPDRLSPWYRITAEALADADLFGVLAGAGAVVRNRSVQRIDLRRSFQLGWGFSDLFSERALQPVFEPHGTSFSKKPVSRRRIGTALRKVVAALL